VCVWRGINVIRRVPGVCVCVCVESVIIRRGGWRSVYVRLVLRVSDINLIRGARNCSWRNRCWFYNSDIRRASTRRDSDGHSQVSHGPDARGGAGVVIPYEAASCD